MAGAVGHDVHAVAGQVLVEVGALPAGHPHEGRGEHLDHVLAHVLEEPAHSDVVVVLLDVAQRSSQHRVGLFTNHLLQGEVHLAPDLATAAHQLGQTVPELVVLDFLAEQLLLRELLLRGQLPQLIERDRVPLVHRRHLWSRCLARLHFHQSEAAPLGLGRELAEQFRLTPLVAVGDDAPAADDDLVVEERRK